MAKHPIDILLENLDKKNIAEGLDDNKREEISRLVKFGYESDESSRTEWKKKTEEGIKIAEQVMETKTYPWPGASNVKFPLIAIASIQFAARAYPSIIQGSKVVKAEVVGKDPQNVKAEKARRVSTHMSWQLLEKMQGWDEGMDKLLHVLPVVGTVFKKTYWDELNQVNASDLCMPLDVVVHMLTQNLQKCRRITHKISLYKNEVIERERAGLFLGNDADYFQGDSDEDLAECFLEQHRWLDLDGDGYEEPYIVTVHEASNTLVRIVACYDANGIKANEDGKIHKIDAVPYFTDYHFIPASSGKYYSLGFAHLLGGINEALSTSINLLIDTGHMAATGGGFFGKGARMKGGTLSFKPNEWKPVDVAGGTLRDNIVPNPVREPSSVLFQLLGLLNDLGMKLASVSDAMAGETPSQNTPATTTLAVIEQGLKVFTAIYKRIFRSLKSEFGKLRRLNSLYLEENEYFTVLDEEQVAYKKDYTLGDYDIVPVADPTMASDAQRMAKAQAVMQTVPMIPTPEGKMEALRQYYDAIQAPNIDKLLPVDEQGAIKMPQPPPDPQAIELQLKTVQAQHEEERKRHMMPIEHEKLKAEIDLIKAQTANQLAQADSKPIMDQLETLSRMVAAMHKDTELKIKQMQTEMKGAENGGPAGGAGGNEAGGATGMATPVVNAESPQVPGGVEAGGGAVGEQGLNPMPAELGPDGAGYGAEGGGGEGNRPYPGGVTRG